MRLQLSTTPFRAEQFACVARGTDTQIFLRNFDRFVDRLKGAALAGAKRSRRGRKAATVSRFSFVNGLDMPGGLFQSASAITLPLEGAGSPLALHEALKQEGLAHVLFGVPALDPGASAPCWTLVIPLKRGMNRPPDQPDERLVDVLRIVAADLLPVLDGLTPFIPLNVTGSMVVEAPAPRSRNGRPATVLSHTGTWAVDPDECLAFAGGTSLRSVTSRASKPEPAPEPEKRSTEAVIAALVPGWSRVLATGDGTRAVRGLAQILKGIGFSADVVVEIVRTIALRAQDPWELDGGFRSRAAAEAIQIRDYLDVSELLDSCGPLISALAESSRVRRHGLLDGFQDLNAVPDDEPVSLDDAGRLISSAIEQVTPGMVLDCAATLGVGKTFSAEKAARGRSASPVQPSLLAVMLPPYPGPATTMEGVRELDAWSRRLRSMLRSGLARFSANAIIAEPDYQVAWQVCEDLERNGTPVRLNLGPTAKDAKGQALCTRVEWALRAAKAGLSAKAWICGDCPDRRACIANKGSVGPSNAAIVVGVHAQLSRMVREAAPGALVIIDEVPKWRERADFEWRSFPEIKAALALVLPDKQAAAAISALLDRLQAWFVGGQLPGKSMPLKEIVGDLAGMFESFQARKVVPMNGRVGDLDAYELVGPVLRALERAARCDEVTLDVSEDGKTLIIDGPDPELLDVLRDRKRGLVFLHPAGDGVDQLIPYLAATTPTRLSVIVIDKAEVTRIWVSSDNLTRRQLLDSRKQPKSDRVVRPLRELMELARSWTGRPGGVQDLLLVTIKPIAQRLRALVRGSAPQDDDEARVRDLLADWLGEGRRLDIAHFGGLRGQNRWQECDGCVTLGDPRTHLEDARRENARLGGDFDRHYRENARAELAQVFGRLRAVRREEPLFMAHAGNVVPGGWHRFQKIRLVILSRGSPPATSGELTGPELKALRARTGMTQVQFSRALNVSERSLRTAESTEGPLPRRWEIAVSKLETVSDREQKEGG